MLQKVNINGFIYFADVNAQVLYTDRDKKSGTPFTFLTKDESKQVQNELRFPRKEKYQLDLE
jgi:ClpP class serine protease